MKKLILLALIFLGITTFAQRGDLVFDGNTLKFEERQAFESKLLKSLKTTNSKEFQENVSISKSEILNINDHLYLRTYYSNNYASTSNLVDKHGFLSLGDSNTSCTSKACANGGGCYPKFMSVYCEPCKNNGNDCIRTTTN